MQTIFLIDWPEGGWGFLIGLLMGMALASVFALLKRLSRRDRDRRRF